jgi:hypothetical protein
MAFLVLVSRYKLLGSASFAVRPTKNQVRLLPGHFSLVQHQSLFDHPRSFSSSKNPPSSAPRSGRDSEDSKGRQHISSSTTTSSSSSSGLNNNNNKQKQSHPMDGKSTPNAGSGPPPIPVVRVGGGRLSSDRLTNDGTKKEWFYSKQQRQHHDKLLQKRLRHRDLSSKRPDTAKPMPLQVPVISQSSYYYYYPPSSSSRMTMRPGTTSVPKIPRSNSSDDSTSNNNNANTNHPVTNRRVVALPAVNASAFLDPMKYSKKSCTPAAGPAAISHGVSKSISGADAMRRLLRGKKEFVQTVRNQLLLPEHHQNPQKQPPKLGGGSSVTKSHKAYSNLGTAKAALLTGHGVPPELLQHFIDMGDALLNDYDDAAEFSFHNYAHKRSTTPTGMKSEWHAPPPPSPIQLPEVVRIRNADATNRCTKWPPASAAQDNNDIDNNLNDEQEVVVVPSSSSSISKENSSSVDDWNHHLSLYLVSMERIAGKLASVLTRENPKHKRYPSVMDNNDDNGGGEHDDDDDDFTSSPLLFPNASNPDWTVDIMRGSYYDLHTSSSLSSSWSSSSSIRHTTTGSSTSSITTTKHTTTAAPPVPIVEWVRGNNSLSNLGHVLIRIQGHAKSNDAFWSSATRENPGRPVSLVFDACFRTEVR